MRNEVEVNIDLIDKLQAYQAKTTVPHRFYTQGRLTRLVGLTLEAVGVSAPIGSRCFVGDLEAEVVGFADDKIYLMPIGQTQGVTPGSLITMADDSVHVGVGAQLLGRVIDSQGCPLDQGPPLDYEDFTALNGHAINPLRRDPIHESLDVGIQAINALFPIGRGQRLGLFAGSGVGKSVLLGMMTRFTGADVIVVGLIGERGREVKEFIEHSLGPEGLARSVVVASPADTSPLMRLHGALWATSIAEHFRDQGANVLLLMDSLTRFAQAQREIALAIGEPPATKGYPPSVFAKIPQLIERAGNGDQGRGSITAIYTVLTEGDDQQDPIADAARAILDGHIVLSRQLADSGHFPAIDIEASISRVVPLIADQNQQQAIIQFKHLYSKYQQNRDLISVGAYQSGTDPELDLAIACMPQMLEFLRQGMQEKQTTAESLGHLSDLINLILSQANE